MLFRAQGGSGNFFVPAAGRYIGAFQGIEAGPGYKNVAAGKTDPNVKWKWALFNVDGTPVIDPQTNAQAVGEGLSGTSLGFGKDGDAAKGRVWLQAHLATKGIVFPEDVTDEQIPGYVEAASGCYVFLTYGTKPRDTKVFLKTVEPYDPNAPVAAAPVPVQVPPTPAVAATPPPMPAAPPVTPMPAPAAPLAVPAAAPFVPTGAAPAPVAVAAGIPAMPFPVAQ